MKKSIIKGSLILIGIIVILLVSAVLWFGFVLYGKPRNQEIDSIMVERNVAIGMTLEQVMSTLRLTKDDISGCTKKMDNGETYIEIVGSSPPWRDLSFGCHSIVLRFDKNNQVIGGYGIWWAGSQSDRDTLQLRRKLRSSN